MTGAARTRLDPWPTWLVIVAVHGLWFATVFWFRRLPLPVAVVTLGIATAWHSSMQHELIHGHPFSSHRLNNAIGSLPLGLWMPFEGYRESHLRHHRNEFLTDVREDPESWYSSQQLWQNASITFRALLWFNRTLVGRMVVGPPLAIVGYYRSCLSPQRRPNARQGWVPHLVMAVLIVGFSIGLCRVPVWAFAFSTLYLGTAIIFLRSFAEHRWVPHGATRSAMVRSRWGWSLLYLNNNLHAAHHSRPEVPWYELPATAATIDADERARTGAGWHRSYFSVAKEYAFRPFCQPVHPDAGVMRRWSVRRQLQAEPAKGQ